VNGTRERTEPRRQVGQAVFEFVLILPLLLMLGAAIWEYGRIFDAQNVLTDSAREGARFASANWASYWTSGSNTPGSDFVRGVTAATAAYLKNAYGPRLISIPGQTLNPNGDISVTSIRVQCESEATGAVVDAAGCASGGIRVVVTVTGTARVFAPFVPGLNSASQISAIERMRLSGS